MEALSAFVDGDAPEWAAHVGGCAACRSTVAALRAVRAAVGSPVEPPAPQERDRAVAAAVAGRRPRRGWRWTAPASAAAALLVVIVTAALLSRADPSPDRATTAAPAFDTAPTSAGPLAQSGGGAAATAGGIAGGDLGEIPDAATLLSRARPALAAQEGTASTPVNPGTSNLVGTRACEEQARAREPSLGQVVYFATAGRRGMPAFVLGFATGPGSGPVTLLMLAQDGCVELLRAAGP